MCTKLLFTSAGGRSVLIAPEAWYGRAILRVTVDGQSITSPRARELDAPRTIEGITFVASIALLGLTAEQFAQVNAMQAMEQERLDASRI